MIKILSFMFWKTGHFLLDRPITSFFKRSTGDFSRWKCRDIRPQLLAFVTSVCLRQNNLLSKGSISLELQSAPIDSQGWQFITGFCILMGSYFARTAWRSMVMTSWRIDHDCGQQCYCQKESPGDLFVFRYYSSNSLCTKHDIFCSKK